jgi:hypothetical protein
MLLYPTVNGGFVREKSKRIVLVIEVKQGNGQWEPVACVPRRPFTMKRANDLLRELQAEYPFLKRPFYRERVRIEVYTPLWVATQAARHQVLGKEPRSK